MCIAGKRLDSFDRVLFSDKMTDNLASVGKVCEDVCIVVFDQDL